jgi:hypothetical protein
MLAVVVLSLVIVALLVDRHLTANRAENERAAHASERVALVEQATDERRELLTRLQHPDVIVTRAPSHDTAAAPLPVDDEWADVGVVKPLIEADEPPVEATA